MRFHGINLLCHTVKLDGLSALDVAAGAGFLVLVWILCGAFLKVFLKEFSLFQIVTGSMQQACIFFTIWRIARMSCIVSLALSSVALLGFGCQGGCSPLFFLSILTRSASTH